MQPLCFADPPLPHLFPYKVFLIGGSAGTGFTVYDIETRDWDLLRVCSFGFSDPVVLTLSSRVFVMAADENGLAAEFFYTNSSVEYITKSFQNSVCYGSSALAVPAKLFSHLPGGCTGVL